jgi:inner membrane protein
VGVGWAVAARGRQHGLTANAVGLALATVYLGWGVMAQLQVERVARESLVKQGISAEQVLVTPAPLNSVLWRVVAMSGDGYYEGFYSLLDDTPAMHFDRFERGTALAPEVSDIEGVQHIAAFSKGFYKLAQAGDRILISDLRMGQEPDYIFTFAVAERHSALLALATPVQLGTRTDVRRGLNWLWRRTLGEPLPPPR